MVKYIYNGREYSEDKLFFNLARLLDDVVDNEDEVSGENLGKDYYIGEVYVGNNKLDNLEDIVEELMSYGVDIVKKENENG